MKHSPSHWPKHALRALKQQAEALALTLRPMPDPKAWAPPVYGDEALARELQRLRQGHGPPALAVAIVRSDGPVRSAVSGITAQGLEQPALARHRFHAGSTTKLLTALLAAQLVAEGRLTWATPLPDLLPGVPMHEAYRSVTLHDLLIGASGLLLMQQAQLEPADRVRYLIHDLPARTANARDQRRSLAEYALAQPPRHARGARHEYSNAGWALAGHVLETCAGAPWEQLAQTRVFDRLGMSGARLGGWPACPQDPDQPRGHHADPAGLRVQPLDDAYVLPPWMNPAGGLHLPIGDFGVWAQELLRGLRGTGRLLPGPGYAELFAHKLRVRMDELYPGSRAKSRLDLAYGAALVQLKGYRVVAADGSAGTFYARVLLLPSHDLAFAGFVNSGAGEPVLSRAFVSLTGLPW